MLYIVLVTLFNLTVISKISLTFGGLFGQNVAFEGMFALDLTCTGQRKSLLCARICLHFWHFVVFKIYKRTYFFFLGVSITIILFPSSLGV